MPIRLWTAPIARWLCVAAIIAGALRCGGPTISRGIYGNLSTYNDTGCGQTTAFSSTVAAYSKTADPNTLSLVGYGTSGYNGFYQIDLPPGKYCLWLTETQPTPTLSLQQYPFGCSVEIQVSGLLHCDYEAGPGGGVWLDSNRRFCGASP